MSLLLEDSKKSKEKINELQLALSFVQTNFKCLNDAIKFYETNARYVVIKATLTSSEYEVIPCTDYGEIKRENERLLFLSNRCLASAPFLLSHEYPNKMCHMQMVSGPTFRNYNVK